MPSPGGGDAPQTGCSTPANEIVAENCLPGDTDWAITGAGSANIQGFATSISVNRGGGGSRSTPPRPTIASTSIAWAITAARGRARSRRSSRRRRCRRSQPSLYHATLDRAGRLRQLGRIGLVGGAVHCHVRHLFREAGARDRHRRAPATSCSSCATTTGSPSCCSRHRTRPGRPTTTTAATASISAARPGRAYKVSYNRPFNTPRPRRRRASVQRRVPDGAVARGNGYDVSYISGVDSDRSRLRAARAQASSCRSATTSTGRASSAPTSRRRATPASTWRSSAATRCSGRRDGRTASTASGTPYRTLVSYKETHANAKIDPDSGLDRHLARSALQPAGRRRPAGERPDRHDLHGQRLRTPDRSVPAAEGKHAVLAQYRGCARWHRRDTLTLPPGRSATSGTKTSTTASARRTDPAVVDDRQHPRRTAGLRLDLRAGHGRRTI